MREVAESGHGGPRGRSERVRAVCSRGGPGSAAAEAVMLKLLVTVTVLISSAYLRLKQYYLI